MNNLYSTHSKKIISFFICLIFACTLEINAQTPEDPNPPGPFDPGGGEPSSGAVPVDGGLALLLAAGAGYGAKKAYDYRKNKVKSEK